MLTVVQTPVSSVDMPGHDTIIRGGSVRAVNINVGVNINSGIVTELNRQHHPEYVPRHQSVYCFGKTLNYCLQDLN